MFMTATQFYLWLAGSLVITYGLESGSFIVGSVCVGIGLCFYVASC